MSGKLSWKAKIGLPIFGLVVAVVLLELGLRLAGFVVQSSQVSEYVPSETSYMTELRYQRDSTYERYQTGAGAAELPAAAAPSAHAKPLKIVAIGDSFVNAGNARSYQTYPYHLFKLLESSATPATVLNMGICQDSTFGVAARLINYLREIKDPAELPDVVAVFAGSADKFNLNPKAIKFDTVTVDWHDDPAGFFDGFRVVKLFRHIQRGLANRSLQAELAGHVPITEEGFASFRRHYEQFKANAAEYGWTHWRDSAGVDAGFGARNVEILASLKGEVSKYFTGPSLEHVRGSSGEQLLNVLAVGPVLFYASTQRRDEALRTMLRVQRDFPVEFWAGRTMDFLRYELFQMFQLQSQLTAEEVLAELAPTLSSHPELKTQPEFGQFLQLLSDSDAMDAMVDQRRRAAWDEIVATAQAKGVKIVVQNYPTDYTSANAMLKEVATKYGLPLVDNEAVFAGLVNDENRREYLEDDDHCTSKGYGVIARALFDVLVREGIVKPLQASAALPAPGAANP
ncbi:MAG: hypothetical protein R3F39_19930 [Myxococcota bacterium]